MSDPIGAAVSRFTQSLSNSGLGQGLSVPGANQGIGAGRLGGGDSAARQIPVADGPSFGDTLKKAINDVSAQQDKASDTLGAFLRGENVELHQVMAATEEAQISLQMLIEVRNKFTDAYKSLANMQG